MYGHIDNTRITEDIARYGKNYAYKLYIFHNTRYFSNQMPVSRHDEDNLSSLNLEVLIVAFLLFTLPILIFLAYRYGKKMGRKEASPALHFAKSGTIQRKLSEESTSDNSLTHLGDTDNKPCSTISSPVIKSLKQYGNETSDGQISSALSLHLKKRGFSLQAEDEKTDGLVLSDDAQLKRRSSPKGKLLPIKFKSDTNSNVEDLQIFYFKGWDEKPEYQNIIEEKLLLHSDKDQHSKKEIKLELIFQKNGEDLQETNPREIYTLYNTIMRVSGSNFERSKEKSHDCSTTKMLSRARDMAREEVKLDDVMVLNSSSDMDHKVERQISAVTNVRATEETAISGLESRIESVVEKYDVPDETGKFNKIFKDAEWIGQGSFGEVYKVVHRLDGKLYAVKKVKLKLGRFEELKKESRVFREVFAMTDLHHDNIVRYSTCWVELEWDKDVPSVMDQAEKTTRGLNESMDLGDISENEINEEEERSEDESGPADYSRNSEMDFEWDVSVSKREMSIKKDKKEAMKKVKEIFRKSIEKKSEPRLRKKSSYKRLRTLSKSFIEEDADEHSRNSSVSRVESVSEVPGCNLYLYIQMEYCEGQSLKYFLENSRTKIERSKILEMFKKLAEGVHAIHSRGILHRDLKPANIFLDSHENVKIGDFGLALLDGLDEQRDGQSLKVSKRRERKLHSLKVGTPMYTSPEQESGGNYDQKTDIYSLGLIFYEMLVKFETHHERYEHFGRIRSQDEFNEMFRKEFADEGEIIRKMLSKSAEDRLTSEQLLVEIDRLIEGLKSKADK